MKPVAFDYCRAENTSEALAALTEYEDDASVLAGGMSLGPMLNMRLAQPEAVIDINRIAELGNIESHGSWIETGACVSQADALRSELLTEQVPLLGLALPWIGHYQTRNRGTLGGSIAHADPSAELPLCLVTLGGEVELRSERGVRAVAANHFFEGTLTTTRAQDELVTCIRWPVRTQQTGYAFEEIAQRHGDFAIVAAACSISAGDDGMIEALRLGFGGIEDKPVRPNLDSYLGALARPEMATDIAEQAANTLEPMDDATASADYRRSLAKLLGARVITSALSKCSSD